MFHIEEAPFDAIEGGEKRGRVASEGCRFRAEDEGADVKVLKA